MDPVRYACADCGYLPNRSSSPSSAFRTCRLSGSGTRIKEKAAHIGAAQ